MSLDDLDLEKIEHILKGESQKPEENMIKGKYRWKFMDNKKKTEKLRKKSRSRSRSHNRSSHSKSKSSSSKSKSVERNFNKNERNSSRYQKGYDFKPNERRKRDDLTVILLNLSDNTFESDIFKLFKKCGKIRDIKILKNLKNKKSKGIAYVEFYDREYVDDALALSGSILCGNEIRIQLVQAEKNRQNKIPTKPKLPQSDGAKKIYVGGLVDQLAELKEQDIKTLFEEVGEVDFVDIHRDLLTGKSKGYAFVQFKDPKDAKEAVEKMDGIVVANKSLKVGYVQSNQAGTINSFNNYANNESLDLDDESGHNFLHNSQSRAMLMQKLTRANNGNTLINKGKYDEISQTPTNCLLFVNMYTKEEILSNKNYLSDLKTELQEECKKLGEVKYMFLDPETEGNIWVKFNEIQAAINAQKTFNDRYFAGKKVSLFFIKEEVFKKKFSL